MTKYYGTETERVLVEDFGIADTRAMSIRQAMREMHRAVCYLDKHNLKRIWHTIQRLFPLLITMERTKTD